MAMGGCSHTVGGCGHSVGGCGRTMGDRGRDIGGRIRDVGSRGREVGCRGRDVAGFCSYVSSLYCSAGSCSRAMDGWDCNMGSGWGGVGTTAGGPG